MNEAQRAKVMQVIDNHGRSQAALITILQDVQAEYSHLSQSNLELIAGKLGITIAKVYGVATFFENFSLEAKGKHIVKVCNGTACHVRKAQPIYDAVRAHLGLTGKHKTTDDGIFTLETVACLGAGGSMKVYEKLTALCAECGLKTRVALREEGGHDTLHFKRSGCQGYCEMGPLVEIRPEGILYTHVHPEDCEEILEKTILHGEVIDRLLYKLDGKAYAHHDDIPFYKKQRRVVLETSGNTDAEDLDEYLAHGGYEALEKALFELTPKQICAEVVNSGLRGRGGAGFPTGKKWESVRRQPEGKKYVVCNGDEGDPGAFMDQSIMEGNLHAIIEGMMIAGRAAGSDEGYIYVRAEYPLAVRRLYTAIAKAEEAGLLGDDILGSGFSFHLHVNRGAGANGSARSAPKRAPARRRSH